MAKDDMIELEGTVVESLPNTMFNVDIGGGHTILALRLSPCARSARSSSAMAKSW